MLPPWSFLADVAWLQKQKDLDCDLFGMTISTPIAFPYNKPFAAVEMKQNFYGKKYYEL